jgi:pimeloyl-ACP methyl ester carboxylesterase
MAKALPNSRFVIVERCGHLSALEQPEIVTAALRDWLLGVGIWQG